MTSNKINSQITFVQVTNLTGTVLREGLKEQCSPGEMADPQGQLPPSARDKHKKSIPACRKMRRCRRRTVWLDSELLTKFKKEAHVK